MYVKNLNMFEAIRSCDSIEPKRIFDWKMEAQHTLNKWKFEWNGVIGRRYVTYACEMI